jgi:hypothetical protein
MRSSVVAVAACAFCGLLGAWLALFVRRLRERARGRAYNARGKHGERDAERILQAHGYRIRARQARTSYRIDVDRRAHEVELVMDFLVTRAGEELVAEVKTGPSAPKLERADTRRQLLEYQLATGARRVLLVDPDAETITEISFPVATGTAGVGSLLRAVATIALLAAAAVWWQHSR